MAIIKKYKGTRIGSNTSSYWWSGGGSASYANYLDILEDQNFALVEDFNDNTLYFADSSNDAVNLNPNYNKKLSFAKHMKKNVLHGFSSNLLFTTKPKIQAKFNKISVNNDFDIRSTQIENHSFLSNLDLDDAYSSGNFMQFNKGGDRYSVFVLPDRDGTGAGGPSTFTTTCGSQVILAIGDDLSTAQYVHYTNSLLAFDLLNINVDEQLIYLKSNIYYSQSADRSLADYPSEVIHVLPFKTISQDGEISFEDLVYLFRSPGNYNSLCERGSRVGIYYIGQDNDDSDCFLAVQNTEYYFNNNSKQDTLQLNFFKIDNSLIKTATTETSYSNNTIKVLDCVESHHSIDLSADQAVSTDYDWQHNPIPTKLQNFDSSSPNEYWFYIPLFKNNGYFSPIAIKWNKNETVWANEFELYEDLINTDTTSDLVNPLNYTGNASLVNNIPAFLAHTYSYITDGSGLFDLHFTFNFLDKNLFDEIVPSQTTLLTNTASFTVDPNSPQTITFTNVSNIPSLNSMLLYDDVNNSYDELLCITPDSLKSYYYSRANGWTASYSDSGLFSEVAIDSYSRRWAIESPIYGTAENLVTHGYAYVNQYNVNLHLISQVLPYTTSVAFSNPNVTYAGVDIPNTLIINAYDQQGSRIAVDVVVNIEGTNMVFTADNSTTTSVVTSAASDTVLNVTITGPGYANVSVSFDI